MDEVLVERYDQWPMRCVFVVNVETDGVEIGFHGLFAQLHNADRERDFGVDDVLSEKLFGEIAGDDCVILRVAEVGGDPLEGFEKAEKIFVGVEAANFVFGDYDAVSASKGGGGDGLDGAFEVEMKFGFGSVGDGRREGCHLGRVAEDVVSGEREEARLNRFLFSVQC